MEKVYTEAMLKPLKKADLYEILLEKGIEVSKTTSNEDMIAMILAKNPPADDGDKPPDTPENNPVDEPKADEGTNTPPDDESATDGEQGADDGGDEPPADDDLPKYTPEQLIKSSTYSHRRDVLRVLLNDGETYSHAKIAWMLKKFYESKDSTLTKSEKAGEK